MILVPPTTRRRQVATEAPLRPTPISGADVLLQNTSGWFPASNVSQEVPQAFAITAERPAVAVAARVISTKQTLRVFNAVEAGQRGS